jgi:hypothetical protein
MMARSLRPVAAQYTNDPDVLPSPETLRLLAQATKEGKPMPADTFAKIAEASAHDNGQDPDEAARLLRQVADRMSSMRSEQAERKALFARLDNLYYPETISEPGGATHWPEGRKPGRAHVSDNIYPVYVDVPASLQAVIPIESVTPEDTDDEEREAAGRIERAYFAWKDEDDFELKVHQACVVKGLYGHTFGKVWWNAVEKRPTLTVIERPENFYAGWGSSDYDRLDWGIYTYALSPEAIEADFGVKVGIYGDRQYGYYPYVVGDHADPIHTLSTAIEYRRRIPPKDCLVEVYDYWYKKPIRKGKTEVWNAIFVGNRLVEHAKHAEYDDIPYLALPNTYIPGSPYGRPELYDIEQLVREKDERLTAAAQMIDSITNGQMWQLVGSEAPDEVPTGAVPKPNKVAAPGPNARLEALQPFVPQFAVEDYLKRIDSEIETVTGLNEVLLGKAPIAALGSSKAMNALVALYEARIRMKRDLLYRWRKQIWRVAAKVWERKDREVKELIDGRYRIDVKAPELTPKDELEVAQMAINLVNARLWSMERAMDRTGVEDPTDEKVLVRSEQTDPTLNPAAVQAQATLLSAMSALQAQGAQPPGGAPAPGGGPSPEQSANASRQANQRPRGTQALNGPENKGNTPAESQPANAPGGILAQTMLQNGEASGRLLSQTQL